MQWNDIAAEWPGSQPRTGDLAADPLAAVLDVLAAFSPEDVDCRHALWEGWGWLDECAWGLLVASDDGRPPEPAGLPAHVLAGPRLRLPGRDHLLFRGPLRAALRMGHQVTEEWLNPQSPSLLWPADRSWCLATEIDFDSTLIGGSRALVDALLDALLDAPGLDMWEVGPADDLSIAGDTVNG